MPKQKAVTRRRPREEREKKQIYKRKKSMRGVADNPYGEPKIRINLSLTPTAVEELDSIARGLGISRSELIERFGRKLLPE